MESTDGKPGFEDYEEARSAHEVLARPSGVPRGHERLGMLRKSHVEEIAPSPKYLDRERTWFIPALAYCMMRMDRSLFELYSWAIDKDIDVVSYRTDSPLVTFSGVDISKNPWFHTVQGAETPIAGAFTEYIKTYKFNDTINNVEWCLHAAPLRIADPFHDGEMRSGIDAIVFLPECMTTKRKVCVIKGAGLHLGIPELGIVGSPE